MAKDEMPGAFYFITRLVSKVVSLDDLGKDFGGPE